MLVNQLASADKSPLTELVYVESPLDTAQVETKKIENHLIHLHLMFDKLEDDLH